MIKMSGGSGAAPWLTAAQFMSGLDMPLASACWPASMIGMPIVPPAPAEPPPAPTPVAPAPPPAPPEPSGVSWNWQPAPAITLAAPTIIATPKRAITVDRFIGTLHEVSVLRNLTGLLLSDLG